MNQPRVADVFHEYCGDFLFSDLSNDPGNVVGRRLCVPCDAFWCDEFHSVGIREVTEGSMRGDDLATVRRNPVNGLPYLLVQGIELSEIGPGVGKVAVLVGTIGEVEAIANVGNVDFGVRNRLPGVRIRRDPFAFYLERLDAIAGNDCGCLRTRSTDQSRDPAL